MLQGLRGRVPPVRHEDNEGEGLVGLGKESLHVAHRGLHQLLRHGGVGLERPAQRLEVQERPGEI